MNHYKYRPLHRAKHQAPMDIAQLALVFALAATVVVLLVVMGGAL